jgi:integrase
MRRGELLALRLSDINLDRATATVRIERSLEETREGLRFKPPKTAHGKRTISLAPTAIAVLREHRRKLLETRMALGLGKPNADTLLFGEVDGTPRSPRPAELAVAVRVQVAQAAASIVPRPAGCRREQPAPGAWEPQRHPPRIRASLQAR